MDLTIPRVCISVRGTTTRIDGLEDRESRSPADAISLPAFLFPYLYRESELCYRFFGKRFLDELERDEREIRGIGGFHHEGSS